MKYSGIIIAGGKSKRMGFDKTAIVYKEKSFLQNAIDLLQNFCDDIVISSNQRLTVPYTVVPDVYQDIGPIGGLYASLQQISNDKAIVIPVDMPLLTLNVVNQLIKQDDRTSQITIFQANNRLQSLVGIYHKRVLPVIEQQILSGNYKLQNLLQKSDNIIVDGAIFDNYFININTPVQLQQLLKQHG